MTKKLFLKLEVPDNLLPGEQKQFNLQIERLRKVPTSINIDTDQVIIFENKFLTRKTIVILLVLIIN